LVITPPDPSWPARYEAERARIVEAIGPRVLSVEHFGSTAVPGISAKPIIDVLVTVPTMPLPDDSILVALEAIGYVHRREMADPKKLFLGRGSPLRTHHLHIVDEQGAFRRLLLRDYFRAFPLEARRYEGVKLRILQEVGNDIARYYEKKFEFLVEFDDDAYAWHEAGRPAQLDGEAPRTGTD
jgi:GrpB-like predicted nucleotidyltransferase (UPF0157 family)